METRTLDDFVLALSYAKAQIRRLEGVSRTMAQDEELRALKHQKRQLEREKKAFQPTLPGFEEYKYKYGADF